MVLQCTQAISGYKRGLVKMLAETVLMSSLALGNPDLDLTLPEPPAVEIKRISNFIIEKDSKPMFRIVEVRNEPYREDLRMSILLHSLDVMTTIYAIENRENLIEGNPLLPEKPEPEEIILQKAITLTFLHHNFEAGQIYLLNWFAGATVLRNMYMISKYE